MREKFKRILCPVDFSAHSEEALRYAGIFARASLGKLFLFHAIENPLSPFYSAEIAPVLPDLYERESATRMDIFHEAIQRATEMLRNFSAQSTAGCNCHFIVECSDPGKRILEFAEEEGIELIVMGTHGRTGLKHLLMGSVAEKIVRDAPCPVVTVHAPQERSAGGRRAA